MKFLSTKPLDAAHSKGERNLYGEAGTYLNHSFCWVVTSNGTSALMHLLYISFLSAKLGVSLSVWLSPMNRRGRRKQLGAVTTKDG